ncbi:hypothetical protein [Anabaena sp. PCC 7108]|uniref:hypothetical protein n=1 Tax=Anabaena sp. PCC 7108 TaxID=163908 RepID=UPI00034C1AAD|nr:hypothetical protein [Anabaena sp. PCC 7108]
MTDKEVTNRKERKEREGRRKKEEGRRKKEEGRRKKEDLFTRQLVLDRLLVSYD